MDHQQIKIVVHETLTALGFDLTDPQKAQADMIYLRKIRVGSEMLSAKMKLSIAGVLLSAGVWVAVQGLKSIFKTHGADL